MDRKVASASKRGFRGCSSDSDSDDTAELLFRLKNPFGRQSAREADPAPLEKVEFRADTETGAETETKSEAYTNPSWREPERRDRSPGHAESMPPHRDARNADGGTEAEAEAASGSTSASASASATSATFETASTTAIATAIATAKTRDQSLAGIPVRFQLPLQTLSSSSSSSSEEEEPPRHRTGGKTTSGGRMSPSHAPCIDLVDSEDTGSEGEAAVAVAAAGAATAGRRVRNRTQRFRSFGAAAASSTTKTTTAATAAAATATAATATTTPASRVYENEASSRRGPKSPWFNTVSRDFVRRKRSPRTKRSQACAIRCLGEDEDDPIVFGDDDDDSDDEHGGFRTRFAGSRSNRSRRVTLDRSESHGRVEDGGDDPIVVFGDGDGAMGFRTGFPRSAPATRRLRDPMAGNKSLAASVVQRHRPGLAEGARERARIARAIESDRGDLRGHAAAAVALVRDPSKPAAAAATTTATTAPLEPAGSSASRGRAGAGPGAKRGSSASRRKGSSSKSSTKPKSRGRKRSRGTRGRKGRSGGRRGSGGGGNDCGAWGRPSTGGWASARPAKNREDPAFRSVGAEVTF